MTQRLHAAPPSAARWLARGLRPFARVEPSEAVSVALLTLTVFTLLLGYYLLKTAREPLILLHGGAEVKSYASAGQSLLLLLIIPAYAALARRVGRVRLLVFVYGFFVSNLLVFATLLQAGVEIGVAFYLWVGIFNNTAIAQLWGFANDLYTPEQGKRLFTVLGIGSSVGAVAGAFIAKRLALFGPLPMQLIAAALLVVCALLVILVEHYDRNTRARRDAGPEPEAKPPLEGPALQLLLRDKYLIWIALLTFVLNCVNTTGEYLLDRTLLEMIGGTGATHQEAVQTVASFKADYFGWVNLIGVVLQLFVVSRVLQLLGVARALFVLPIVAFASYGLMWLTPVLAWVRLGKIAENSLDYSLQNTARQALFLVGTRAEKYLGKTVIDTFVVRMGDVFSAMLVYGAGMLHLPSRTFALVNLALVVCWLGIVLGLGREHARRARELAASQT
ncbi:MAG TPA: MFS transporter [Polyangiales bacterium]|nr:MFS transporter [Polyangiales bacterium]